MKIKKALEDWQSMAERHHLDLIKCPDEILADAADVLKRDGWIRDTLHDSRGAHCALGAIQVASGLVDDSGTELHWDGIDGFEPGRVSLSDEEYDRRRVAAHAAIEILERVVEFNTGDSSVPNWNDDLLTEGTQVVSTMRKTAAILRDRKAGPAVQ